MHRGSLALLITGAAVAAVVAVCHRSPERGATAAPPAGRPPSLRYEGVASCAAGGCHHGNEPREAAGSEYTTWVLHDPHSRAYEVLTEERSRLMVRRLKGPKAADEARPEAEQLCLGCHVLPGFDNVPRGGRFSVQDGVGCEACHGPAERWLRPHPEKEWRAKSAAEKHAAGMRDTKDLAARAGVCVGCHVGGEERDVNHDLIAAGHPRLRFELASYLANYPRHWRESDDKRGRPDFEVRAWAVGQVASAKAELELLRHRATTKGKPWPEFSAYDCSACHHDLTEPSWRQRRGGGKLSDTPAWGTWYFAMLPALVKHHPAGASSNLAPFDALAAVMRGRVPDPGQAANDAERAAAGLSAWLGSLPKSPYGAREAAALLETLVRDEGDAAGASWDSATQLYLGMSAVYQGLSETDPGHWKRPALEEAIRAMGRQLEAAFPEGRDSLSSSPHRFRPDLTREKLNRIREQVK